MQTRWRVPLACLLLGTGRAEEVAAGTLGLMDTALAHVAALSGKLSRQEETAAVLQLLSADAGALLLAKHFGALPSYETHLHAALGGSAQTDAPAPAAARTDLPAVPSAAAAAAAAPADEMLFRRRSIVEYDSSVAVPEAVVDRALEAAILAPNHFLTEPWRFYLAGPRTRDALSSLNEKKAEIFRSVPGWLVVSVAASGELSSKKGLEDYAATACAVHNFMLSLAANGVGSKWMTGALGVSGETLLAEVGADRERESLVGVVWFGYPAKPLAGVPPPKRSKGLEGVLTRLP